MIPTPSPRLAGPCVPVLAALVLFFPGLEAGFAATGPDTAGWDVFRGPAAQGLEPSAGLPAGDFGLSVAWTQDLGSGYSNVSAADGRLFTMFTREPDDVLAAFDAQTGEELWSHSFGAKYAGHDGSEDGPLSTPAVAGDVVFAVGPRGQVVAVRAATGDLLWQFDLTDENSTVPLYGYTTSPLVLEDSIVLATGGDGHAITAIDRFTGEPKWAAGSDSVQYQTPSLVKVGSGFVLVAVTDHRLYGMDPDSGELLWELTHSEGEHTEESAHVTPLTGGRFVVDYQRGARLYRATDRGVEEVWAARAFGSSLSIPVEVDGYLYGFTRNILTCVDAETGEIVWRSREPGGQGLSRVGDVLAIVEPEGHLVLVDPSPDGYREITRTQVLGEGEIAAPSFAGDAFVVRNMTHLAAVRPDVTVPATGAPPERVTQRFRGEFGAWVRTVEALPEASRQAAVDRYFANVGQTPLVERGEDGNALAHVVWRGDAEDVGLGGEIVNHQDTSLERVEGTDLFFVSLELVAAAQYGYNLLVDFGDPQLDPSNPLSFDTGDAQLSELRMPDWPPSPHLDEPAADTPRGSLDTFRFRSEILDVARQVQLWLPPGLDPDTQLPLLVVNHGDNVLRGGLMRNTLDNLVGRSVAPLAVVFVPRVEPAEYGGPKAESYTRFLVEELLPHLERHYPVRGTRRALMGSGSAAVASLLAIGRHPEVFQRVAVQSFYPIAPTHDALEALLGAASPTPEVAFVAYSNRDYDLGGGVLAKDASQTLLGWLRAADVPAREMVTEYSPSWAGWRGQHDDILRALFPLVQTGDP